MNHYITPDNKTWGFEDNQAELVPSDAVLIPDTYTIAQIPYITLINGVVYFNQTQFDADIKAVEDTKIAQASAKASAIAKLASLGLTESEVAALLG
jgi:hypothetical protein